MWYILAGSGAILLGLRRKSGSSNLESNRTSAPEAITGALATGQRVRSNFRTGSARGLLSIYHRPDVECWRACHHGLDRAFLCRRGDCTRIRHVLTQMHWYGDDKESAKIKAVILGLLTAIPTALPALLYVPSGVLGVFHNLRGKWSHT